MNKLIKMLYQRYELHTYFKPSGSSCPFCKCINVHTFVVCYYKFRDELAFFVAINNMKLSMAALV